MPPQQICKVHSSIRTPSAARCRYYVFADGGRGLCHFVADGLIWPVPSALYFGGVVWQQYVQRELLVDPPIGRTRGRCPPWLLPLRRRCCWRIETGISDGGLSVERCRIPLKYVGTGTCYIRCICTIPELPPSHRYRTRVVSSPTGRVRYKIRQYRRQANNEKLLLTTFR